MTFEKSNASMVAGLVDYMSTLVSGGATNTSNCECSDKPPPLPPKPPPLPPKVHRVNSVDRALPGLQPAKQVCSWQVHCLSCPSSIVRRNVFT